MNRSKIEWTDYTFNPIKGLCPIDCKLPDGKSYCYARRMYQRFGWNPKLGFNSDELWQPSGIKKPSRIFVCSTFELFHSSTDEEIHIERDPVSEDAFFGKSYRDWIFHVIEDNPQHTFQILTKFPQNIDREMPNNVWLGVTITNEGDLLKTWRVGRREAKVHFISIEPMLERIDPANLYHKINWIIIGRLTGYGNKHDPKRDWINEWFDYARWHSIPLFLKNNLKPIWGENLIQEMP